MIKLSRKNKMLPFEDEQPLEFLAHKNDASLFMFGSHNKKRPHNIVMGRLFDFHILDLIELSLGGAMADIDDSRRGPYKSWCVIA